MRRILVASLAGAVALAAAFAPQPAHAWWRPALLGPRLVVIPAGPSPYWVAAPRRHVWWRGYPCCWRPPVIEMAPAAPPLIVVR